jgi:hypothetical protein
MDPASRASLRRAWLECIHEFSSTEKQRRWLGDDPQHVASFTECMCFYFDDLNLGEGLDAAIDAGWISQAEAHAVAEFHEAADRYQEPGDDSAVLADPGWSLVVTEARRAWLSLRNCLTDEAELKLWHDLEGGTIVSTGKTR